MIITQKVKYIGFPIFGICLISVCFLLPNFFMFADGSNNSFATVRNIFRKWNVPLYDIKEIKTKYFATIFTFSNKKIVIWTAPTGNKSSVKKATKSIDYKYLPKSSYGKDGSLTAGDLLNVPSGKVATALRDAIDIQNENIKNNISVQDRTKSSSFIYCYGSIAVVAISAIATAIFFILC